MELQQLRYVVALAEELSFTRAAARCHVVQSALSHQIKILEKELGVELFARTSRRVEPTEAGMAFLPPARASLAAAESAAADAAAAAGLVRGRLTMGVIPTVAAVDLPAALKTFRQAHPQVQITLQGGRSDDLESAVAGGQLDVALIGALTNHEPRGVASRLLDSDHHIAVLSREHPLSSRREVQLLDLADEIFADFPAGTPGRQQSDQAFARAAIHRDVPFEVDSIDLMLGLVRQNLAITLLPSKFTFSHRDLAVIQIADGPSRMEHILWSRLNPSPATKAFLAIVNRAGPPADSRELDPRHR
ncbi:LysR family transcriptional regulator [Nocardia brasiliensis]|uniref:LysR family transcriptional regulator n=1 Tax=Nocardia brasiliensis TaxID=37326 RepID=UPI002454A471|nr:LysR family transcriptional regulator [Nocardia brasiliensis]